MRIDAWGVMLLVWVGGLIPWLGWRSALRLGDGELPFSRVVFFWQTTLFQLLFFAIALFVAATNHARLRFLPFGWRPWALAAVLLVVAITVLLVSWPRRSAERKRQLLRFLPQQPSELLPYFVVCISAGIGEELLYRGTAWRLLIRLGLSVPVAIALLVVAFALGHVTQGVRSAIAIAVIAAGFHAVVIYGGGALLPAIVAHVVYDAVVGVLLPRSVSAARRDGAAETAPDR